MTPEGAKTTPQIVSRTISQPSIQSVSQSASQSGGRAGRQGVGQSSVSQSVSQPVSLSASQPVSQSANRAVSQSIPNTLIPTRHSGEQAKGKWIYVCTETQKDFRENVYEAKLLALLEPSAIARTGSYIKRRVSLQYAGSRVQSQSVHCECLL
jgi:hypothetical protein